MLEIKILEQINDSKYFADLEPHIDYIKTKV